MMHTQTHKHTHTHTHTHPPTRHKAYPFSLTFEEFVWSSWAAVTSGTVGGEFGEELKDGALVAVVVQFVLELSMEVTWPFLFVMNVSVFGKSSASLS